MIVIAWLRGIAALGRYYRHQRGQNRHGRDCGPANWATTVDDISAVPRLTTSHGRRARTARGKGLKMTASSLTWARR